MLQEHHRNRDRSFRFEYLFLPDTAHALICHIVIMNTPDYSFTVQIEMVFNRISVAFHQE